MTEPQSPILALLHEFSESVGSSASAQSQIATLCRIKKCIMDNPNNYHHPQWGNATFLHIYEFVIECLSQQHPAAVGGYLLHTLALMVRCWVLSITNLRELYDGVLQLFQQRTYCGENCFRFLCALVEAIQNDDQKSVDGQFDIPDENKYSSVGALRSSIENYFVYHLLNQLLAFANVFLERSVVRNESATRASECSRARVSQSFDQARQNNSSQEPSSYDELSQECELYLIQQPESVLLSILSLVRACLSYDFSHTARHQQESEYELTQSPIILPTKFSKYCKFSEYDILLKNDNTTQMFNYLFLVCGSVDLKLEILNILKLMSRIHFRYFKNKGAHKLHLENIGFVISNLITGLDIGEGSSASVYNSGRKDRQNVLDRSTKINIVILLGEIVGLLLYHQPTFYIVEAALIDMILERVEAFIMQELLDPENFIPHQQQVRQIGAKGTSISPEDLYLLIETFMGPLYKLKDYFKLYLADNEMLNEKLNEVYLRVGRGYFQALNARRQHGVAHSGAKPKQSQSVSSCRMGLIEEQSSRKLFESNDKQQSAGSNLVVQFPSDNEETTVQPIACHQHPQDLGNDTKGLLISAKQHSDMKPTVCRETDTMGFLENLLEEGWGVERVRNIMSIFKVYCPKHTPLLPTPIDRKEHMNSPEHRPQISHLLPDITDRVSCWFVSWLCNFEHYFFITAGHCRHSQPWQVELKIEFMRELLEDLSSAIQLVLLTPPSGQQPPKLQTAALDEKIKHLLLYLTDKVTNQCRLPCVEYLRLVNFDILAALDWVIQYNQGPRADRQQLQPLVCMLCNLNYNAYFKGTIGESTLTRITRMMGKIVDKHPKVEVYEHKDNQTYEQAFRGCLQAALQTQPCSELSIIEQDNSVDSKLLHVLSQLHLLCSGTASQQFQVLIQRLFRTTNINLLCQFTLELSSTAWHSPMHSWHIDRVYDHLRPHLLHIEAQAINLTRWVMESSEPCRPHRLYTIFVRILQIYGRFLNIERRTHHNMYYTPWGLLQEANRALQAYYCPQLLSSLLCLYIESVGSPQCHSHNFLTLSMALMETVLGLEAELLQMQVQDLEGIVLGLNQVMAVHCQPQQLYAQIEAKEGQSAKLAAVRYCEFLLQMLAQLIRKYGCSRPVAKLEHTIMQFTAGSLLHRHHHSPHPCVLGTLQSHHTHSDTIALNVNALVCCIFNHLQARMFSDDPQPCLLVAQMVSVLSKYHQLLENLLVNYEAAMGGWCRDPVVAQCLGYMREMGVGWLVRKLEEWDNGDIVKAGHEAEQKQSPSDCSALKQSQSMPATIVVVESAQSQSSNAELISPVSMSSPVQSHVRPSLSDQIASSSQKQLLLEYESPPGSAKSAINPAYEPDSLSGQASKQIRNPDEITTIEAGQKKDPSLEQSIDTAHSGSSLTELIQPEVSDDVTAQHDTNF